MKRDGFCEMLLLRWAQQFYRFIQDGSRYRFAHFKLRAHFLGLRLPFCQCLINVDQEYPQWKHQQHKDHERYRRP